MRDREDDLGPQGHQAPRVSRRHRHRKWRNMSCEPLPAFAVWSDHQRLCHGLAVHLFYRSPVHVEGFEKQLARHARLVTLHLVRGHAGPLLFMRHCCRLRIRESCIRERPVVSDLLGPAIWVLTGAWMC